MPEQTTYLKSVPTTRNGSSGVLTATRYELMGVFGFGEKVVEKYLHYGTPEQRVETYQYYTETTDYGYGKVSEKVDFDGKWTKYTYDQSGRVIKEVSPFGDAPITSDEDQCQVITYDYNKLEGSEEGDPNTDTRWRTRITTTCGQETAREFRQYFGGLEKHIVATAPGAVWSDASNQVQATWFYTYWDYNCEMNIRRETRIENPDGTTVEISYVDIRDEYTYTLQKTSITKFMGHGVSKEVEEKNYSGFVVSLRRYDLSSGGEILAEGYDQTLDGHNRPLVKTDVDGFVTTFEYYQEQVPDGEYTNPIPFDHVRTIYPDGSVRVEAFDTEKKKIFETYDDITTFYRYDAYGNTISTCITGRDGGTLETTALYTEDNQRVSETDANGNTTTYAYGAGRASVTDALGNVSKREYHLDGRLKNVKLNDAIQRYYAYEVVDHELVTTKYASEAERSTSVTGFDGNIRQKHYPDGYEENFYFDGLGRQIRTEDNCCNKTTTIYHETTGRIFQCWQNGTLFEFASGHAEDDDTGEIYRYDRGYTFYQEARVLATESRVYRNGLKIRKFNSGNIRTAVKQYSGDGEVTETVIENGIATTNLYLNGILQSSQNAATGVIEYVCDEFNRSLGYNYTENEIEKSIRYTLDDNGNVLTITQGAGEDSRTVSYEFDELNQRVKETTPEGIETSYTYNAQGQITAIVGGVYLQEYEYDIQERMISLTTYRDANTPEVTAFEYDNRGRMCKKTYDDESTVAFSFRGDDSLANITNARGQTIQCTYDNVSNRLIAVQGTGVNWKLLYDYRGLLLRMCSGSYYQDFGYDEYGKLTSENFSDISNTEIGYCYDGANRLAGYSFAGNRVRYTYDANTGSLSGVNSDGWNFDYHRVSGSNKLSETIACFKKSVIHAAARGYNDLGDLTDIGGYGYQLDLDGKRLGATLPDGKEWAYSYDGLSQVTGGILSKNETPISNHAYTYDLIGNRLTSNDNGNQKQYAANNLNQYTAINNTELIYDADGNLLFDSEFTYSYDALNQLVSVQNATDKQVFVYDFMGKRIGTESYQKHEGDWSLITRRRYIYQGWNVIAEYVNRMKNKTYIWGEDLSGTLQEGGGVGGLLLERNCEGDYLPVYDGNGNIIAYKNHFANIVATYSYDPFGNTIKHSGLEFTYNFSTKSQDFLTGLYYYGYRFYNQRLGRWLSRDPIGENGGENLYVAGRNNLIGQWDKLGQECCNGEKLRWGWKCCIDGKTETPYFKFSYCCCAGSVLKRGKIPTGVRHCTLGLREHDWLEIGDEAYGFSAKGSVWGGPGQVTGTSDQNIYVTNEKKECKDIKLDPCKYDIDKFRIEVRAIIGLTKTKPISYNWILQNCGDWARQVIKNATPRAKRSCK